MAVYNRPALRRQEIKEKQMKSKKLWKGIPVLVLVFGILLIGCETEPDDPTYTVWTGTFNFSGSYESEFGGLYDGNYLHFELSNSEFEQRKSFFNSSNVWTEDQIYSYLIGLNFSSDIAKKESSWLVSVKHGCIGSRKGESLNIILK
jgi:hypothetical protein